MSDNEHEEDHMRYNVRLVRGPTVDGNGTWRAVLRSGNAVARDTISEGESEVFTTKMGAIERLREKLAADNAAQMRAVEKELLDAAEDA